MKFLDPESRLYCAAGKYTSLRGSLHSLWRRRGGGGRGNRDISARSHGLHRVKLGRSFGKKAAPSFRAGRRIDRGKEMIRFFCHDDPFFSGGNALSPRGGYFIRRGECKSVEVVILKGIRRSVFCREAAKIFSWWIKMVIFLVWIGIVYFMVANGADVAIRVDIS